MASKAVSEAAVGNLRLHGGAGIRGASLTGALRVGGDGLVGGVAGHRGAVRGARQVRGPAARGLAAVPSCGCRAGSRGWALVGFCLGGEGEGRGLVRGETYSAVP
jgi:hypothetical protein